MGLEPEENLSGRPAPHPTAKVPKSRAGQSPGLWLFPSRGGHQEDGHSFWVKWFSSGLVRPPCRSGCVFSLFRPL